MIALLATMSLAGGALVGSAAQNARRPNRPPTAPASQVRVFDMRSQHAWDLVQKRLKELGLPPDELDRANQLAFTKWRDVGSRGLEWLPAPAVPEGYVAERVRFQVFVSPFTEPAHVYVGSLCQIRRSATSTAMGYNVASMNGALMAEIARALGQEGQPLAASPEQRRQLALSALKDEADDCLRRGPPKDAKITPPRKIRLSELEFIYPAPAVEGRTEGAVKVAFTVLEDGGITDMRVEGAPLGDQLEEAAMGTASLLRYAPARLGACPIPVMMTYTVRYRGGR